METNDKWYIRGKKGCAEQVKRELIKRGAKYNVNAYDVSTGRSDFEDENLLFTVVEGVIVSFPRYMYYTHDLNWQEIEIGEPKPKHTFKPYDKVLMCDGEGEGEKAFWLATEFACYTQYPEDGYKYRAISSRVYRYCIPYLGNEELNNKRFSFDHIRGYE